MTACIFIIRTILDTIAPQHLRYTISTGGAYALVFGTRFALAETIACYDGTQMPCLARWTLLRLAIVPATQYTDAFLACCILELAANRIADIVFHAGAQITLHTCVTIPVKLIAALTRGANASNTITDIALSGF